MLVMDCSALFEIMQGTEMGRALQQLIVANERIIAPDLLCAEIGSVVRKAVRAGMYAKGEAQACAARALALVDEFCPLQALHGEVISESIRLDHSVYDLFYFVLARRTGATLFTVDKKLAQLCEENGVNCVYEISVGTEVAGA